MKYGRVCLAASLVALSGAAGAEAADLGRQPSRTVDGGDLERMPALWRGLYWGLAVGASGGGVDVENIGKKDKMDVDGSSLSVSVIGGYNFTNGPWIWGIEADLFDPGLDERKAIAGLGTLSAKSDWHGSLRLRAGYAWDRAMVYGTAGLALAELEIKSSLGGKDSSVQTGIAAGLGAEYAIDENWRVRVEGLVYSFSDDDVKLAGSSRDISWGHSTLRSGIMRKF